MANWTNTSQSSEIMWVAEFLHEENRSMLFIYTYIVVCSIISFVGMLGNAAVFCAIVRVPTLRTTTNFLILSLVVADLLGLTVLVPLHLERFFNRRRVPNNGLCITRKYLYLVTSSGSLISLAAISLDRMLAICHPYIYSKQTCMNRLTSPLFIMIWVLFYNSLAFYPFKEWTYILPVCSNEIPKILYCVVTPIGFYVPGLLMFVVYVRIFCVARVHARDINSQQESGNRMRSLTLESSHDTLEVNGLPKRNSNISRSRSSTILTIIEGTNKLKRVGKNISREIKTAKTIFMIFGSFIVCWFPSAIIYLYTTIHGRIPAERTVIAYLTDFAMALNFVFLAINPFVYSSRNIVIRSKAKKCCKRFFCSKPVASK